MSNSKRHLTGTRLSVLYTTRLLTYRPPIVNVTAQVASSILRSYRKRVFTCSKRARVQDGARAKCECGVIELAEEGNTRLNVGKAEAGAGLAC